MLRRSQLSCSILSKGLKDSSRISQGNNHLRLIKTFSTNPENNATPSISTPPTPSTPSTTIVPPSIPTIDPTNEIKPVPDIDLPTPSKSNPKKLNEPNYFKRLFPWRDKIKLKEMTFFRLLQSVVCLSFIRFTKVPYDDFMNGVRQAFRYSAETIFEHIINKNEESKVDFTGTLSNSLATFFKYAISKFNQQDNTIVEYELLSIGKTQFIYSEILLISSLLNEKNETPPRIYHFGAFKFMLDPKQKWKSLNSINRIGLRIWVELNCEEKLLIKDKETDKILQGDLLPKSTLHKMVLRTVFRINNSKIVSFTPWAVEDIDFWVQDNSKWISSYLASIKATKRSVRTTSPGNSTTRNDTLEPPTSLDHQPTSEFITTNDESKDTTEIDPDQDNSEKPKEKSKDQSTNQ